MFAPPFGPSSCSIGGCVLLLTSAVMAAAGTALIPITCPVRIGVTPSGLPIDSGAGGDRSGPTPRGSSSPSWPIGLIPNRDSGPVSACFGCSRILIPTRRADRGPRGRGQRTDLQEHRLHHRQQARTQFSRYRGRGHRTSQSARPRLLPLKGLSSMLTHPTLDLLHSLGLHGMAKGFKDLDAQPEARSLEHAEWLALLLQHEKTLRQQKRFESRARAAKLRHAACVEDVDYRAIRGLDRALFLKLAVGDWIRERHNLLVTGPCGVGKSWLACALGHKACRDDFAVAYHRVPRLFAALALGRADGRYTKMLRAIARLDLLILDDWGPEPLDADQRRDLLEIVEDRYEARSIIVTSQLPVDRWYEINDAILDRLVHNAYRIELKGESLRKQKQSAPDQSIT